MLFYWGNGVSISACYMTSIVRNLNNLKAEKGYEKKRKKFME
jgi:hypothetical protein